MAHITTGVEYGLHSLLYLARTDAGASDASVRDLAELQHIPTDFLAKLFTRLAKGGVVTATEGLRGGYRLARPANRITVLDVVIAIDGEKTLFECKNIRQRCALFGDAPPEWSNRGVCSIHAVMLAAEKAMREELRSQTLADLAQRVVDKASAGYGAGVTSWLADRATHKRSERDSRSHR